VSKKYTAKSTQPKLFHSRWQVSLA